MNFVINSLVYLTVLFSAFVAQADMRESVLRKAALKNGLLKPKDMIGPIDKSLSAVGEKLFKSKTLSLNSDMTCQTCHLDKFSSADGLPNAVGIGGKGEGINRMRSDGKIVPRNTLPLWGRGGIGFNTFFWDGKVQQKKGEIVSQFGKDLPSRNPLEIAVHLPFVEIREMMFDDDQGDGVLALESTDAAGRIYEELTRRVKKDLKLSEQLSGALKVKKDGIVFSHIAKAVAEFIRDEFQIRSTKLHRFVFDGKNLTTDEIAGGLLFYGKGNCSICHNGPMFTDYQFHTIPLPQIGFGKNGFGIDFGRYNVTFDPSDTYKFRTPPLFNVSQTQPYGHSGSVYDLSEAIRYHFDPLWSGRHLHQRRQRQQFYNVLKAWGDSRVPNVSLDQQELSQLTTFLKSLSFEQNKTDR